MLRNSTIMGAATGNRSGNGTCPTACGGGAERLATALAARATLDVIDRTSRRVLAAIEQSFPYSDECRAPRVRDAFR